jgi:hypothetical protein
MIVVVISSISNCPNSTFIYKTYIELSSFTYFYYPSQKRLECRTYPLNHLFVIVA